MIIRWLIILATNTIALCWLWLDTINIFIICLNSSFTDFLKYLPINAFSLWLSIYFIWARWLTRRYLTTLLNGFEHDLRLFIIPIFRHSLILIQSRLSIIYFRWSDGLFDQLIQYISSTPKIFFLNNIILIITIAINMI